MPARRGNVRRQTAQVTQNAGCFRRHGIEQALGRRLLLSLDRIQNNTPSAARQPSAGTPGIRCEGVGVVTEKLRKRNCCRRTAMLASVLECAGAGRSSATDAPRTDAALAAESVPEFLSWIEKGSAVNREDHK
jgi:hypothetical protein